MNKTTAGNPAGLKSLTGYSAIYLLATAALLLAFLPVRQLRLSSLAQDFRWRNNLIQGFATFRWLAGDHVFPNAVIGKNDWIFFTGESSMADYQRTNPSSTRSLHNLQEALDALNADLASQGRTLLVVIPPDKSTVYSKFMPDQIHVIGKTSRLDQFVSYMRAHGTTRVIDLRSVLLAQSATSDVYFRTDTHWNDLGAYYASSEILAALSQDYPSIRPYSLSDFTKQYVGPTRRDLPPLMGFLKINEETWALTPKFSVRITETDSPLPGQTPMQVFTNADSTLPSLLIYHDSFYGALAAFINPRFSRVTALPVTGGPGIWNTDWIRKESPDVVIIELVERYLNLMYPLLQVPN